MIKSEFAKALRDYAFTHPELSELSFTQSTKDIEFIGIIGNNDAVNEYMVDALQDDIFIDASYNNIYEDFLKSSYIDDNIKDYFKKIISKASDREIGLIIDEVFITPIMKASNINADTVYIRVIDGMKLSKFKEIIRLD